MFQLIKQFVAIDGTTFATGRMYDVASANIGIRIKYADGRSITLDSKLYAVSDIANERAAQLCVEHNNTLEVQKMPERSACYKPNDGVYPLCAGQCQTICENCCQWENYSIGFPEE